MSSKFAPTAPAYNHEPGGQAYPMRVKIEGLTATYDEGVFEISGVTPVRIEFEAVMNLLIEAGIPRERAGAYTDDFLGNVAKSELGHLIASRLTYA